MDFGAHLLSFARTILCVLWMILLLPIQIVAFRFRWRLHRVIPKLYHRGNCWIMGLDLVCQGQPSEARPTLFVANHTSYLDIIILASLIDAHFIAKEEIAGWPVFGLLAKLNGTVFITRRAIASRQQRDEMQDRLDDGDSLILFPEGTSSDGQHVLRFNSTYFSIAEREVAGQPLTVQPVSLGYIELNGLPMGRANRPFYAWYGDMEILGHMWTMFGLGRATIGVIFHEPVSIDQFASRKEMASFCHQVVAEGLSDMLTGRRRPQATKAGKRTGARLTADRPVLE